ncbi:MAG: hypothetical protein Q8O94_01290 [bacterium]|nr:hypothetical protein [bacterium]
MKRIMVFVVLALVALANAAQGAGTGMPMMKGLENPTELATMVDSSLKSDPTGKALLNPARCKKDGSCATAHDYFYGIQLAHPSAKLGNIAELSRYLRSLVKKPAPSGEWYISRLLVRGEKHTYDAKGWHRAFLKDESVWVDPNTGELILAGDCGNVIGVALNKAIQNQPTDTRVQARVPQFAKPSGIIAVCPDVYTLKVNVWEHKAIALSGVEKTHRKEELAKKELKERFVGVPHVSRTHGGQFRKAYANGKIKRSAVAHNFRVSLIMTPESQGGESRISSEEILGDITVTGLRELQFTRKQLEKWDAIRVVPIEPTGIYSPPRSNLTGVHGMRFFNHLPGKKLGEWENNPVPDCIMNEHWIED